MASKKISVRNRVLSGLAGAIALAAASQGHAMTVVATFDPSITNDPNGSGVEPTARLFSSTVVEVNETPTPTVNDSQPPVEGL